MTETPALTGAASSAPRRAALSHMPGRRSLRVLLVLALVSLPAVTPRIHASDEVQYFAFLRSLWFDGDVSFENEYRHFYDSGVARAHGFHETYLELVSETGLRVSFATIGSALLWSPFYAAADLFVVTARATGASIPRDGYSWPYVAAVCYGSALYGVLALLLSVKAAAALGFPPAHSTLAAIAVWIGTPLVFYTHVAPVMAHATSAFAVALFVVVWLKVRDTWSPRGAGVLGAVGALMIMVREQDVTFIALPAVDLAFLVHRDARRGVRIAATAIGAATVAFAVTFVPQALAYLALNGRIGPPRLVSRKMNWLTPHAWDILASPQHGFFFWTPLAVVALAGLAMVARQLWRAEPWPGLPALPLASPHAVGAGLLAAFAAQVYVLGSLESWTSAGAFGQRRFVGSTVLLVIGLTGLFAVLRTMRARRVAGTCVAVAIWWNLALMAAFGAGLMDRQRLALRANAYAAFVTVPVMVPQLAYRYLFDRASFYRRPEPQPREP